MSKTWQDAYSELKGFIARNPEITVATDVTILPGDLRPEFYRFFDAVREAVIIEKCRSVLDEAEELNRNWSPLERDIKQALDVSEIKLPFLLRYLLDKPKEALASLLFDPLFNLLKGRMDAARFEQAAVGAVEAAFERLFKEGYEKWVLLSLLSLLASDSASVINLEEIRERLHELQHGEQTGCITEALPALAKASKLSLGREGGQVAFLISSIVVRSGRLDRYFSITGDLAESTRSTPGYSETRHWLELRPIGQPTIHSRVWPDMVAYVGDQPDEISLVADFSRFCRPDVIIECMEQERWYESQGLEKVKRDYDFFKPGLGTFVVSRHPVPEEFVRELVPENAPGIAETELRNIRVLSVGFDRSRLEPVVEALAASRGAGG